MDHRQPVPTVSEDEAYAYYHGISHSPPKLLYRSDLLTNPWVPQPVGPGTWPARKQVLAVFRHPLADVWEEMGPKLLDILDHEHVDWSTVDVCRFLTSENQVQSRGPVVIWVGVNPAGANRIEGMYVATGRILGLLDSYKIEGVTVECRESELIQFCSKGPYLLSLVSFKDPTRNVRGPLTPALGLSICASDRVPEAQGTVGLYFAEGGESDAILALTCHHVLFKADFVSGGEHYCREPHDAFEPKAVQLLGSRAFQQFQESVNNSIKYVKAEIAVYEEEIDRPKVKAGVDQDDLAGELLKSRAALGQLQAFEKKVSEEWCCPERRVIGHVRFAPKRAYNVGPDGLTEDWGVIELDKEKFKDAFSGNVMDLSPKGLQVILGTIPDSKYPFNSFLHFGDIIPEEELRHPKTMLPGGDEPCLLVMKSGAATGLTIGCATGIHSFARDALGRRSKEWAIYNNEEETFSKPGDSGSVIIDGKGRIGGLLTSGTGKPLASGTDVTYATPMDWLWPRIKETFPHAHLHPTMDPENM
ncbi:hypothetical protein ONZ45_g12825 [Pleurotus djamor]|nr:hypothetical protein ONZ45_g12825 [Pleurotus djamor]